MTKNRGGNNGSEKLIEKNTAASKYLTAFMTTLNGHKPIDGLGGWYYPLERSEGRTTKDSCNKQN